MSRLLRALGLNINKPKTDSLKLDQQNLIFIGGCKYESIPMQQIESICYHPRDDIWQEISIKTIDKGTHCYYLNSDTEVLKKAIEQVNLALTPTQPICKFILSAKQGALSGKD